MRKFGRAEIEKRAVLVTLVDQFNSMLNRKKSILSMDWTGEFNKGRIKYVEEQFRNTCEIVDSQLKLLSNIAELINKQESDIRDNGVSVTKHTRYSELVKSHFGFAGDAGDLVAKAELDVDSILGFLRKLHLDLQEQKKILDDLKNKGAGQQAYSELDLRELTKTENALLQHVKPFWHDWELVTTRIEELISRLESVSDDELDKAEDDIRKLLNIYHAEFADNERASQLGTELALNLYIQGTEEIKKLGNKIPIALINIDMTACNNLDGSHQLGDALIEICYTELNNRFKRDFTKTGSKKKGSVIEGKGVVTILGRTRFKIVGVPKSELEPALAELPEKIRKLLVAKEGGRFRNLRDQVRFQQLNTVMLAGYHEISIGSLRQEFRSAVEAMNFSPVDYMNLQTPDAPKGIEGRVTREHLLADIKIIEKRISMEIDGAVKSASAKAEYLEKTIYPKMRDELIQYVSKRRRQSGIPRIPNPIFEKQDKEIVSEAAKRYPVVLLYDWKVDPVLLGTNYIPEDEFEGIMINRVAHQIGMDHHLTEGFMDFLRTARDLKRDGKMSADDSRKLRELKKQFYISVLQKRHLAKSYELRFINALREDAYDEILTKMMLVEGPQVMTFIEVDGFNAFNRLYKPDAQDKYYHSLLKLVFTKFDETLNADVPEEHKLSLRMTKQGDEIWVSYPLHSERGIVSEKDHLRFLESINDSLISRGDEALQIDNVRTVDWIPYLIEDKAVMEGHIRNSLHKNRTIAYVDNSKHASTEVQQKSHVRVTPENKESFFGGLFTIKMSPNRNVNDFSRWKLLDGAREVNGADLFGPMKFKIAYMLFRETVKKTVQGVSSRLDTGRVIRIGFTMGYAGFGRTKIMHSNASDVKTLRKAMNDMVEHIRKTKGRGGIHSLDNKIT